VLNIRDLQCFVKVYELRSFSRAADALDTVQSQVSTRVRRLEDSMETTLFVRLHRGVVSTAKGDLLYEQAKRVLAGVAEMEGAGTAVQIAGKTGA
jgi:DNA-binding transcriptional LysR family regulator